MPVTVILAALIAVLLAGSPPPPPPPPPSLPLATVRLDVGEQRLVIELPPVDLPAATPGHDTMVGLPLCHVLVPVSASEHSELFLPIGLHLLAASKETPQIEVPRLLFGLPLERGQRLLAGAMVANGSRVGYHGVRVRLLLRYVPAGRPWPLYRTYPWAIDVEYPLGRPPTGSKAFDLPPGRTVRFWEGSPAIAGTILGLGGHLHDYGMSLELADVSAGRVLWHGEPISDGPRVLAFPLTRFYNWHRLGLHIVPTHRYRLTAVYENPTGRLIPDGGMGAVAGLFVPDRGAVWPAVDTSDVLYRTDQAATRVSGGADAMMMMEHTAH